MKTIKLSEVLSEVNKANAVFTIKYRKDDGSVGLKQNVTLRGGGNNELTERRKFNRNGLLKIFVPKTGEERDITIDLITELNGMRVVRPPYILTK
jgi:hypothetical protein